MNSCQLRYQRTRRICTALIGGLVIAFFGHAPAVAQESRLGRLFYTPQERERLDQRRGAVASVEAPQTVIVNGVVVRPGMAPILFLDGKEVRPGAAPAGVTLRSGSNQSIELQSEGGPAVRAKAGQVIDLSSGRSMENYQLTPAPPRPVVEQSPEGGSNQAKNKSAQAPSGRVMERTAAPEAEPPTKR